MTAEEKNADPAEAEKGDIIRYRIEFHNDFHIGQSHDCNCSHYNRTWLTQVTFDDYIEDGLTYVGNVKSSHSGSVTSSSSNKFSFKWKKVDEGDTAWVEFDVKVTCSNMTMLNKVNTTTNFNSTYTKYSCYHYYTRKGRRRYRHPSSNRTKHFPGGDSDYVRILDPEIAGVVWLENGSPDGLKKGSEGISTMPIEQQKVNVELWNETTGQKVAQKIVNADGSFTFGRVRKGPQYEGSQTNANGDDNWNIGEKNHFRYTSDRLYHYYIIYDYDGERYKATINSQKNNLNSDYSMKQNFPIDSNADELNRVEFNKSFETVANNIKYDTDEPTNGKKLAYTKSGNNLSVSKLYWNGDMGLDTTVNATMKAKSFSLFFPDGETEYLKHINLGLVVREEADLSATKDVYKAEVTVNGYQTTYTYEQLGSGNYTVTSSNTVKTPYKLKIYREDYEFRTKDYGELASAVEANNKYTSDGRDNDLSIILTYKITITNNSDTADAVVREILDFSTDSLEPLHAYVNDIPAVGESKEDLLHKNSKYNSHTSHSASGYEVRYIYGDELADETIETGGSLDIYTTYRVRRVKLSTGHVTSDDRGYIIKDSVDVLGKINVAEIAAFSFYEKGSKIPIGLVDKNSNPANTDDPNDTDEYEDDTFRTSIQILLRDEDDPTPNPGPDPDPNPDPNPNPGPETWKDRNVRDYRRISGVVWEEINKEAKYVDGQKVGNGIKDGNDIGAQNVIVKLYEVVTTGDKEYMVDTGLWMRTGADGKYSFGNTMSIDSNKNPYNATKASESTDDCYRLHAGQYVVRFIYGDEPQNLIGSKFENNRLVLDNTGTTLRYSGQDYKSATYTEVGNINEDEVIEASLFYESSKIDKNKTYSVAKDNEARRLEVNAYSTTMTNTMDRILKAGSSEEKKLLAANTSMYADTKKFDMQIEYYENYTTKPNIAKYIRKSTIDKSDHVIKFTEITTQYCVTKVDFGLIERAITKLQLMNDISEIIAETSDGNTILDLVFDVIYEPVFDNSTGELKEVKHYTVRNLEKSTGLDKAQILNRNGGNQGFRYINVDTDILQGMKITLKFRIAIANTSEVDHLAARTDTMVKNSKIELDVQYPESGVSTTSMTRNGNIITETLKDNGTKRIYNYTNSELYKKSQALKVNMPDKIYTYDGGSKYGGAVIGTPDVSTSYTYHNLNKFDSNYYVGYYMGNIYYRGSEEFRAYSTDKDIRVESRTDQYIDYVDNDLVFKTEDNVNANGIITHLTYTTAEIAAKGLMYGVDNTPGNLTTFISDGNKYFYDANNSNTNNNLAFNIEDGTINNYLYKYLPSKTKTSAYSNYTIALQTINENSKDVDINSNGRKNDTLQTIGNPYDGNSATYDSQLNRDLYFIDIQASRTLTSEVDLEGIHIENLAEIVKVSNTAGRKVYVGDESTKTGNIGNSKPNVEKINSPDNPVTITKVAGETDTDFTEFVTFSPPTGLGASQMRIEDVVNKVVDFTMIIVPSVVIVVGSVYVIVQFMKRKKFYK